MTTEVKLHTTIKNVEFAIVSSYLILVNKWEWYFADLWWCLRSSDSAGAVSNHLRNCLRLHVSCLPGKHTWTHPPSSHTSWRFKYWLFTVVTNGPSPQPIACRSPVLEQEVTWPKARFEPTSPKKSEVNGGAIRWQFTNLHEMP